MFSNNSGKKLDINNKKTFRKLTNMCKLILLLNIKQISKKSNGKLENTLNREIMEILHIKTNRKNDALQLKWYLEIYALKPLYY